jgi:hypothetical protein
MKNSLKEESHIEALPCFDPEVNSITEFKRAEMYRAVAKELKMLESSSSSSGSDSGSDSDSDDELRVIKLRKKWLNEAEVDQFTLDSTS